MVEERSNIASPSRDARPSPQEWLLAALLIATVAAGSLYTGARTRARPAATNATTAAHVIDAPIEPSAITPVAATLSDRAAPAATGSPAIAPSPSPAAAIAPTTAAQKPRARGASPPSHNAASAPLAASRASASAPSPDAPSAATGAAEPASSAPTPSASTTSKRKFRTTF